MGVVIQLMKKSEDDQQIDLPSLSNIGPNIGQNLMTELNRLYIQKIYENNNKVSDISMDENVKMILERMDRDLREHRQEIRDRDMRLQAEFQEREKRIHDEIKEREERFVQYLQEIKQNINEVKEDNRTTRNTVIALAISVILGVAALAVTFVASQ